MTEHKYTDDEVIKALECCRDKDCGDCPLCEYPRSICEWDVIDFALDLINRQKAEIADLNEGIKSKEETNKHLSCEYISLMKECNKKKAEVAFWMDAAANAKKEAVKEFAEELKGIYINDKRYDRPNAHTMLIKLFANIDDLVKEFTEEKT